MLASHPVRVCPETDPWVKVGIDDRVWKKLEQHFHKFRMDVSGDSETNYCNNFECASLFLNVFIGPDVSTAWL